MMRESIQELEELGWQTFWFPELVGREAMTHAGFLLSCTESISVINGIAQIWSREPRRTQGAALLLADAYPDRHMLGLGVGVLRRRQEGVDPHTVARAWKAQTRLCGRFRRLAAVKSSKSVAAAAIARELAGFVWAEMTADAD